MELPAGLSRAQVAERTARGESNAASFRSSRTYWDIINANLFNLFNNILFAIGIALIALGQYNDAFTSVGQGLVNAIIGTIQEISAKRKLDQIALLTRTKVRVVRDGTRQEIDPAQIVKDDVIHVTQGDQIVVDGRVMAPGRLEMDESLLTGEPDLIVKQADDILLSGSFCVNGEAYYVAERVGSASYANKLTDAVRMFQAVKTPLQQQIAFAVRMVTLVVIIISGAILVQTTIEQFPLIRIVQISAVLSGQVPYGLFFLVALAYATGAAGIAKRGALVQQTNAIESLSNIDVLCMDKTGTLTANRMQLNDVTILATGDATTIRQAIGVFARSASTSNATSDALMRGMPADALPVVGEIPFASARKWSALAFDTPPLRGVYVLGAVEMVAPYLPKETTLPDSAVMQQVQTWSDQGLRVLVFAANTTTTTMHDAQGDIALPALTPLALVALADELRPQAKETIAAFFNMGIQPKIISGDNPRTVTALATQVGFPADARMISGIDLAKLSGHDFDTAVMETTVFGRITPQQKEQIVDALMRQGHYVAMMGDGVNDALSLKKAKLGIAMESGSTVTRNIADMILLNDSYSALLPAFSEGKRIINGLSTSLFLFLSRVATAVLIIIMISMIGLGFPYEPSQVSLTLFTVGIPTLLLTLWARPETPRQDLLQRLVRFVFPVAIVTSVIGVGIYTFFYTHILTGTQNATIPMMALSKWSAYTGLTYTDATFSTAAATIVAQTALSTFVSLAAFVLILFLEPPTRFFAGWNDVSPDKRPAYLAVALMLIYIVVLYTSTLANYFGLVTPGGPEKWIIPTLIVVWFFTLRTIWRYKWFERVISVDDTV